MEDVSKSAEHIEVPLVISQDCGGVSKDTTTLLLFTININYRDIVTRYKFKYHDKYLWIIHCIIDAHYETYTPMEGFVNLHSKILEKFLGTRYTKPILTQLQDSGIIQRNPIYSAGSFSMSYRLCEPYRSMPIEYHTPMPKAYQDKVLQHRQKYLDSIFKEDKQPRVLGDLCLAPDVAKPHSKFETLHNNVRSLRLDPEVLNYIPTLEFQKNESRNSYIVSSMKLLNNDYWFKQDKTTGRVFHNITNYPKKLRKYIAPDTEMWEVDISNSQIVLLNSLLKGLTTPDIMLFKKLSREGKFYEYIMEKVGYEGDRGIFKAKFFERIYYAKVHTGSWEYVWAKKFAELFPTVWKFILEFKEEHHADLPIALQKLESDIVIQQVAPVLAKEGIFFVTIHDCIVCLEKDTDRVAQLLKHYLKNLLGFEPNLKTKRFNI